MLVCYLNINKTLSFAKKRKIEGNSGLLMSNWIQSKLNISNSRTVYQLEPGKNFPTGKSGFRKKFPFPVLPGNYFPAKFRIFWFQNSKIQKTHKKQKPDFPIEFRCFPVGKHCFSNVKKYFGIYGIAKELLHMYI